VQSTKFRFSSNAKTAEEEWQLVRAGLNKKLSKNFKRKKSNNNSEPCNKI
jgi:hypothetical protein